MRVSIGRARWLGVGAVAKRRSTGLSDYESALVRSSSMPKPGVDSGLNMASRLNVRADNRIGPRVEAEPSAWICPRGYRNASALGGRRRFRPRRLP